MFYKHINIKSVKDFFFWMGTIFKGLIKSVSRTVSVLRFVFGREARGISAAWPVTEPTSLHWKAKS